MNIAFFDFDGTVTQSDSFLPFIHFAVPRPRVIAGTLGLSPLVLGYQLGWVSPSRMRQRIAWVAFRGRPAAELRAAGVRYAEQVIPGLVRPEALDRIRWHQAQGDVVVIVSASLEAYLAPWCRSQQLQLICTELELRGDVCTGRYHGGDCSGQEKARRILERHELEQYPLVFAYGDTDEDQAMLALASHRYFRGRAISP